VVTTFVQGLPSAQANKNIPGFVLGAADIAFLGETPYILIAGAVALTQTSAYRPASHA
jgi:hypothetical protein